MQDALSKAKTKLSGLANPSEYKFTAAAKRQSFFYKKVPEGQKPPGMEERIRKIFKTEKSVMNHL